MDPAEWINLSICCLFIARFESKSKEDDSNEETFMNLAQTERDRGLRFGGRWRQIKKTSKETGELRAKMSGLAEVRNDKSKGAKRMMIREGRGSRKIKGRRGMSDTSRKKECHVGDRRTPLSVYMNAKVNYSQTYLCIHLPPSSCHRRKQPESHSLCRWPRSFLFNIKMCSAAGSLWPCMSRWR